MAQESGDAFEIFLSVPPGLEDALRVEAAEAGFAAPVAVPGGVTLTGGWPEVWRANLVLRGAGRVLARIGAFRVLHLAQLDKRARKFPWGDVLSRDVPLRVEVTCRASRIYHAGAAAQRVETALRESFGAVIAPEAPVVLKVRIEDDLCMISVDTSGTALHKRGYKEAVGKAPMKETLAALFLRACGHDGRAPVLDPMCGSGTFVIEAAETSAGLAPGRGRGFAFEHLLSFDAVAWEAMRGDAAQRRAGPLPVFHGSDRDAGAIRMSLANAQRAGVGDLCRFEMRPVSDLRRPEGPPGLVIVNPPYGARIGERKPLFALYGALGKVLMSEFRGWRVGMVTPDAGLAKATALPFGAAGPAVAHGGLQVHLFQTGVLR